jgi:hypothetical protein
MLMKKLKYLNSLKGQEENVEIKINKNFNVKSIC